jgi:hypothetical protein
MNEEKRQHLEFIQNVITRMNTNSFQLKGMAITIVSAFLAIYAATENIIFIFLGIFPTILFWFLDSYYLQQERKFRGIYNDVTGLKNVIVIKLYEMPIQKYTRNKDKQYCFWSVFLSRTILPLYIGIVMSLLLGGLFIINKDCLLFWR